MNGLFRFIHFICDKIYLLNLHKFGHTNWFLNDPADQNNRSSKMSIISGNASNNKHNLLLRSYSLLTEYGALIFLRSTNIFERYLKLFKTYGVIPYVVFDGLRLPAKAKENTRTQRWEKLLCTSIVCLIHPYTSLFILILFILMYQRFA